MKRITIAVMALMSLTTAQAQEERQDTAIFMNGCREFVKYVEELPALTKSEADSIINYQDSIVERYRQIKPQLNDDQVGEYNRLKGRYTKRMLAYRGDRLSDGLQATGDSIAKTANRVGQQIGGFFKGLFNK